MADGKTGVWLEARPTKGEATNDSGSGAVPIPPTGPPRGPLDTVTSTLPAAGPAGFVTPDTTSVREARVPPTGVTSRTAGRPAAPDDRAVSTDSPTELHAGEHETPVTE